MSKIHFLTKKHSISYTRQGWKDLIQYILHNELEISQKSEYKIKENERIYKISHQSLLCLPSQNISIIIQMNSILQYSIECIRLMMIPCLIQKERNRISTQKRVIIVPPKDTLDSPKWCSNIDEHSSDDLHQIMINEIRRRSSQENRHSRLSVRSISYGFGVDTKKLPHENYHLPANKFALDLNQQDILRRTSSLKRII